MDFFFFFRGVHKLRRQKSSDTEFQDKATQGAVQLIFSWGQADKEKGNSGDTNKGTFISSPSAFLCPLFISLSASLDFSSPGNLAPFRLLPPALKGEGEGGRKGEHKRERREAERGKLLLRAMEG